MSIKDSFEKINIVAISDNFLKDDVKLIEETFDFEDSSSMNAQQLQNNHMTTFSNPLDEYGEEILPIQKMVFNLVRKYSDGTISKTPLAEIPIYPKKKAPKGQVVNFELTKIISDKDNLKKLYLLINIVTNSPEVLLMEFAVKYGIKTLTKKVQKELKSHEGEAEMLELLINIQRDFIGTFADMLLDNKKTKISNNIKSIRNDFSNDTIKLKM